MRGRESGNTATNYDNPVHPAKSCKSCLTNTTTIGRADIDRNFLIDPLYYQLPNHLHECRMRTRRLGAHHLHSNLVRHSSRLDIEIVNNLHMVRNKPDRRDHDTRHTLITQRPQMFTNIRSKPRLHRRSTTTQKAKMPVVARKLPGDH